MRVFLLLLTSAEPPGRFCFTLVPELAAVCEGPARDFLDFRVLLQVKLLTGHQVYKKRATLS